jgi:FkbM family methyltransferase
MNKEPVLKRRLIGVYQGAIRATSRVFGRHRTRSSVAKALRVVATLGAERLATSLTLRLPTELNVDATERAHCYGVFFDLNLNDNTQRLMYYTGSYEGLFLKYLAKELDPQFVYLDVGGHVGIDGLIAAAAIRKRRRTGRVVAVEAAKTSADTFTRAADVNGLESYVTVVNTALSDQSGFLTLYADPEYGSDDASCWSQFNQGEPICTVESVTGDDLVATLGLDRVDLVKIDIEGGELAAIRGMAGVLRKFRPGMVVIELNERRLSQAGSSGAEIDAELRAHGYDRSDRRFMQNQVYTPIERSAISDAV